MKVQILDRAYEKEISGYDVVEWEGDGFLEFYRYSDNQLEYILAPEVLSYIPAVSYEKIMKLLLSKLRVNGELVVGGTSLHAFADKVQKGEINQDTSSAIVTKSVSMGEVHKICDLINSMGNYQVNWSTSGVNYEIKIRRV